MIHGSIRVLDGVQANTHLCDEDNSHLLAFPVGFVHLPSYKMWYGTVRDSHAPPL